MHNEIEDDNLNNLENAILVCFGETIEDDLPQIESADEAMIDILQGVGNFSRIEAQSYLHGQS
ncbi:MAG: hypothetical protein CO093_09075 [Alphaproteobacteria bacterium CG_4_9_14_3_um_filter_47_13]|nr:MAG: hypothetical protein CO093_09075 [Alphaproteobacteria bacterium CG_4_9_14_3_um_filter_47_13]